MNPKDVLNSILGIFAAYILSIGAGPAFAEGNISGTVYDTSGTPIANVLVTAESYAGSPCLGGTPVHETVTNSDGAYTIWGLLADDYLLHADPIDNHLEGWWADPQTAKDVCDAQVVALAADETVTGKDFQLDVGGQISGTVYESGGTPIAGRPVSAIIGYPCFGDGIVWGQGLINPDGTYTIPGLPEGEYFLLADANDIPEWWADPASSPDCSQAQVVAVTPGVTVTGRDFQFGPVSSTYLVTTAASPTEGGTVGGGGTYNINDTAVLTANPSTGNVFTGWSGDATGTTNPLSIIVDSDKNITANFMPASEVKTKGIIFPIRSSEGKIVIISM